MALRVHVCQFHVAISEFASALSRGLADWGVGGPCPRRADASSTLFSVFRCYELMKFIIVVIDSCNPAVVLLSGSCLAPTFNNDINVRLMYCEHQDLCTSLHVMGYILLAHLKHNLLLEDIIIIIYIYIAALVCELLTWTSVEIVFWLHWQCVVADWARVSQAGCSVCWMQFISAATLLSQDCTISLLLCVICSRYFLFWNSLQ